MTLDTVVRAATPNMQTDNGARKDVCLVCTKVVYPMDKVAADDKIFHKTCLRCGHCKKVLSLGNYAALNNVFYCKPHFKQLFALKGNYSDGFKASEAAAGVADEKQDRSPNSSPLSVRAISAKAGPTSDSTSETTPVRPQNPVTPQRNQEAIPLSTPLAERMSAFNKQKDEVSANQSSQEIIPQSASLSERMNALTMKKDDTPKKEQAMSDAEAPSGKVADRLGIFSKSNASTPDRIGSPARSIEDTAVSTKNVEIDSLTRELSHMREKLENAEKEIAVLTARLAERDQQIALLRASQTSLEAPIE